MSQRVGILKRKFLRRAGLPFQEVLSEASIQSVLAAEEVKYRNRLYTPIITIWMFLSQVLEPDKSLSNAVKRVQAWLVSAGAEPPSNDTGGYAKARQRLPERVLERLFYQTGEDLEGQVKEANRWCAEVNLDHITTTLGMEMLLSQTPAMVRKEIYVHLMAYNLLRTLMWKASKQHGVSPLRLSVQGARQSFNQFCPLLAEAGRIRQQPLHQGLLNLTAESKVPLRPGRSEPRKQKRRPKAFPFMKKPRSVLKQELEAA